MSNFIKVSEIKEQRLRLEEMKKVKGGFIDEPAVQEYGIVDPPY